MDKKQDIGLWQFFGFGVVSLLGTLFHYVYDFTKSPIAALFSGVNESTWEHMKLLFFPMFLFAVAEYFVLGKHIPGYWCIKMRGTVLGLLMIPVLFYTLRGIFGTTPDWINIAIFFVAAAIAFWYETPKLKKNTPCSYPILPLTVLMLIAVCFFVFTFWTPQIPLFQDPITKTYGLQ